MSEAPGRVWAAVSERGDLAINNRGERLNGYQKHIEYVSADILADVHKLANAAANDIIDYLNDDTGTAPLESALARLIAIATRTKP